jgi:DNA repair photolyase
MITPSLFSTAPPPDRATMNGKPVFEVPAKSIINFESGFSHKLLCDGPTFTAGSACPYTCTFCYVPDLMRKSPHMAGPNAAGARHEDIVIRRHGAIGAMRSQLTDRNGRPKFLDDPADRRVIYASPLVDVAANMELVRETVEACKLILDLTHWQIRLLSKSNLLPRVAEALANHPGRDRIIYGVSTGTLDNGIARAFEIGTPLVSKRLESLHALQDAGCRTFGMICPSLPMEDYTHFAAEMRNAIRAERCEHVWGEVINVRGESMTRTVGALHGAGYRAEATALIDVGSNKAEWERYARETFEAHVAAGYAPGQLRFLQYVTKDSRAWWSARQQEGAILL